MHLIQKVVRDIIKEVAQKYDLSMSDATEVVMSQFKFVATEMPKGHDFEPSTFSNIMLRYFGTFAASEGKIRYMKLARERKIARQLDNGEEILHADD